MGSDHDARTARGHDDWLVSIRLTLDLDHAAEPITGTIATEDGTIRRPFRGWLDLAACLEAVLATAPAGGATDDLGESPE